MSHIPSMLVSTAKGFNQSYNQLESALAVRDTCMLKFAWTPQTLKFNNAAALEGHLKLLAKAGYFAQLLAACC